MLGFSILMENIIANVYYQGDLIYYGTDDFIYRKKLLQLKNAHDDIDIGYLPELPIPYEETINVYWQTGSWQSLSNYLDWYETQLGHDDVLLNFVWAMTYRTNRESHRAMPLYEKIL